MSITAGSAVATRRQPAVLFIVTSFWAYGELTIAMEFARRLPAAGFRPLFLIPPTHRPIVRAADLEHQVMVPGSGKINRLLLADIRHVHRPASVVLADFMNFDFCDRHYGLRRADLAVFDCPVGTFDDFCWGRPDAWLDAYGFRTRYETDISMDGLAFRLRPCPLNRPVAVSEPGTYHYPLLEDPEEQDGASQAPDGQVRREWGLPSGRPVILLTGATWQHNHTAYPRAAAFVAAYRTMLERQLLRLLQHADVVSVGPALVFPGRSPPGFHRIGQLDPARFRRLTHAVDLHLSNNAISVSLHRLALSGIPSIALFSSLARRGGQLHSAQPPGPALTRFAAQVLGRVDHLYPCRMFPVGWYYFLTSLLTENPFNDVVRGVEIFDENAWSETILPMLSAGPERSRVETARRSYLAELRRLPDVRTILDQITVAAA